MVSNQFSLTFMTLAFKYKLTNDQIKYKWIKIVYKFCSTFPYKELQAILAVNMCINISSQSTNKLPVGLVYHWSSCMDGSKKSKIIFNIYHPLDWSESSLFLSTFVGKPRKETTWEFSGYRYEVYCPLHALCIYISQSIYEISSWMSFLS